MSKTVKTRIKREAMLKALKASLKTMEAEIKAYEAAKVKYDKDFKAYEKAHKDWEKKLAAWVAKNGKPREDETAGRQYNSNKLYINVFVYADEAYAAVGAEPKAEDYLTRTVEPKGLESVRLTGGEWTSGVQVVREAIWNLENSDDEYIYSNTYANVVKFVA